MATRLRTRLTSAARRETILAAATTEFAAAGYDRTRVADIAARIGVTEPVVFQNFGTKARLFASVLEHAAEQLAQHLAFIAARSPDLLDILRALLSRDTQDRLHAPGALARLFEEASSHAEPSVSEAGRRAHLRMVRALAEVLARGQREGSIREDVDALSLAWLVLSEIHARHFRRLHAARLPGRLEEDSLEALLSVLRGP